MRPKKKATIIYIVMQRCKEHVACGSVPVSVHRTIAGAKKRLEQERYYCMPDRFEFSYTTATISD